MRIVIHLFIIFTIYACGQKQKQMKPSSYLVDVQGHRGCRGLLPENTIPAFEKAFQLGVTTLELDVLISKDLEVIISHEPFFHHHISTDPNGKSIEALEEKNHNLFKKTYREIKQYDVGIKSHPNFQEQEKISVHKPSLKDMVHAIESLSREKGKVFYNIELKRKPIWENTYHPDVNTFVDLVLQTLRELNIENRTTLQCFDIECLQVLKEKSKNIPLVYLIENTNPIDINLNLLGFTPDIYSPYYKLVNRSLLDQCKQEGMKLIPWTVNDPIEMERLLSLKVDGIITDYPDRLIEIIENLNDIEIK